jgi:hypothetical protein
VSGDGLQTRPRAKLTIAQAIWTSSGRCGAFWVRIPAHPKVRIRPPRGYSGGLNRSEAGVREWMRGQPRQSSRRSKREGKPARVLRDGARVRVPVHLRDAAPGSLPRLSLSDAQLRALDSCKPGYRFGADTPSMRRRQSALDAAYQQEYVVERQLTTIRRHVV